MRFLQLCALLGLLAVASAYPRAAPPSGKRVRITSAQPEAFRTAGKFPVKAAALPAEAEDSSAEELLRQELEAEEANKNAKYSFKTNVVDNIKDNQQQREEVRDGLKVKGMYTSSDGFFKRTVHYEADENGYRVVKETLEPIGDGPKENDEGTAKVHTAVNGFENRYVVDGKDIIKQETRKPITKSVLGN